MTREDLDFIGSMNMCDEISNEAYKKIVCHYEEQYNTPHDDAVSRAGALKALECTIKASELKKDVRKYWDDIINLFKIIYKTQSQAIKALPPVTPKEKTGKWIKYGVPRCEEQHYQCTNCKWYINFGQWGDTYTKQFKYCPNCKARMVSE